MIPICKLNYLKTIDLNLRFSNVGSFKHLKNSNASAVDKLSPSCQFDFHNVFLPINMGRS